MIYVESTKGSGKQIREYRRMESLQDDDLLVMARKDQQTCAVRFGDLKVRMYRDLANDLSVGSMAYRRDFQFSKKGHDHGNVYNRLEYSSRYSYDQSTKDGYDVLATVCIPSEGVDQEIICPKISVKEQSKTPIGLVKFVYSRREHFRGLSGLNAEDFDGWLVPDGQKIPVSEISNTSYDWTEHIYFNQETQCLDIPLISDFIRLDPRKDAVLNNVVPFVNDIPSHTHTLYDISCDISCDLCSQNGDFTLPIIDGNKGQKTGVFHGSDGTKGLSSEQIGVTLKMKESQIRFKTYVDTEKAQVQTYPTHDMVPVIVYVGGGKY